MPTSVLARSQTLEEAKVISAGNVSMHVGRFQTYVDGKPVDLTYQEFDLLRVLIAQLDSVISYDQLMQALWRDGSTETRRRLGVVICRLRGKLRPSWPYRLQTVRGRGYGLTLAEEPARREGEPDGMHGPSS